MPMNIASKKMPPNRSISMSFIVLGGVGVGVG